MTTDGTTERPYCLCGCGTKTKGGAFAPGHDARYKSQLIQTVIDNTNPEAVAEAMKVLDSRGWIKFLDKKREVLANARAPKKRKEPQDEIAGKDDVYLMKAAAKILKWTGQYYKRHRNHIVLTHAGAALIANRVHPLLELPDDGTEPEPFTEWEQAAVERAAGTMAA